MSNPFEDNFNEFWGVTPDAKEQSPFIIEDTPEASKAQKREDRSYSTTHTPKDDGLDLDVATAVTISSGFGGFDSF